MVSLSEAVAPASLPAARSIPPGNASPPPPGRWRRMKRGCLQAFQAGLEATGLAALYVRLRKVTGTTIFNYHSVAGPGEAAWVDPRYHLATVEFERQMRFLAAHRTPVSLSLLVEAIGEGRDLPPRSVVVTFDDGYLDHATVAAPILAKLRIPATFFLPTGYVSRTENQWVDRLFSSFRRRTRHEVEAGGRRFDLARADQARLAFQRLEGILLMATCPERDVQLERVEDQLQPEGTSPRLTMNWNEARRLLELSPDFEIGGHSRDHLDVSALSEGESRREIAACAGDLRRELGDAPRDFSYPYERWNPESQREVRANGFRSAVGEGSGFLISHRSDRFALPRLDPVSCRSTFGFVTSGAFPALSRALTGRA